MTRPDADLLEARVAAHLVAALTQAAAELPPGAEARLRVAREQALQAARDRDRRAAQPSTVSRPPRGLAWVAGAALQRWLTGVGAAVSAAVLLAGAWLLSGHELREQVDVASTVDVALLADELPPQAYADPGFVEFLKLHQP